MYTVQKFLGAADLGGACYINSSPLWCVHSSWLVTTECLRFKLGSLHIQNFIGTVVILGFSRLIGH